MQRGVFSEVSYKRTVLNKMSYIAEGLNRGVGAASVNLGDVTMVMSSNCMFQYFEDCEWFYLQKTMNDLCEKGGIPKAVQLIIQVPEKYDERNLGIRMKNMGDAITGKGLTIEQCRVYKGATAELLVYITVIGITKQHLSWKNVKSGMDIVMAGTAGLGGSVLLSRLYKDRISQQFSDSFIRECNNFSKMMSVEPIVKTVFETEIVAISHISDGGVFAALWELGSMSDAGVCIDIKKIPIWQQTIELSELFNINPYMMEGSGALLIVCEKGKNVVKLLSEQNIFSAVIGRITKNRDRIVKNGAEVRFLEPPGGDEIFNIRI